MISFEVLKGSWGGRPLLRPEHRGKIKFIRNEAGQRLYEIESYGRERREIQTILYCRVSSSKQRPDLERQAKYLQDRFPGADIIKDIGSGLNYKRKGLKTILERCLQNDKLKVVVAHRDRLCRFGFELIRFIVEQSGGEIVVLNNKNQSPETELTEDLLSILHVFSCRMHGKRSYSKGAGKVSENSYLPDSSTEERIKALVRSLQVCIQQNRRVSETTGHQGSVDESGSDYKTRTAGVE